MYSVGEISVTISMHKLSFRTRYVVVKQTAFDFTVSINYVANKQLQKQFSCTCHAFITTDITIYRLVICYRVYKSKIVAKVSF